MKVRVSKQFGVTRTNQIVMEVVLHMGVTNIPDYDHRDFGWTKWLLYKAWLACRDTTKWCDAPSTVEAGDDISDGILSNVVEENPLSRKGSEFHEVSEAVQDSNGLQRYSMGVRESYATNTEAKRMKPIALLTIVRYEFKTLISFIEPGESKLECHIHSFE